MFFRNNRISSPVRAKIPGVFRILCVGDSLTYGHGVHFDETLPSKLEENLNNALWSTRVEVLNESNCGFSFYDERASLDVRGKYYEPDLLIVILCSNDTELFYHAEKDYTEHLKENWDAQGNIYPFFKKVFSGFCKEVDSVELNTIVAYYGVTSSDEEKNYCSQLSELCAENGMKFVEISSVFKEMDKESLTVSEADGHPSALAHEIASKELAREILASELISDSIDLPGEIELYNKYSKDAEQMMNAGYPMHELLSGTLKLLKLKRSSRKRVNIENKFLLDDLTFSEIESKWSSLAEKTIQFTYLEAYASSLELNGSFIGSEGKLIEGIYREVYKKLFVLKSRLASESTTLPNPFAEQEIDEPELITNLISNMGLIDGNMKELNLISTNLDLIKSMILDMEPEAAEINDNLSIQVYSKFKNVKPRLINYLNEAILLLKGVNDLTAVFLSIPDETEGRETPVGLTGNLSSLSGQLSELAKMTLKWLRYFSLDGLSFNENLASIEHVIHLKVRLKCRADKKSMIMINLNAIVPHIAYHYDELYLHTDEQIHMYYFKLPLYFFGAFRIRTTGTSDLSYESVEIYFNENNRIKFTDDRMNIDENGAFNSPLVLIPL